MHERISIQTYVGLEMGKVSLTPGESGEDHQPGKQIQPIGIQERQISHSHVCVCVFIYCIYIYIFHILYVHLYVFIYFMYISISILYMYLCTIHVQTTQS